MKKFLLLLLTLIILLPAFPQELKKMEIIGKPRKMTDGEVIFRKDANGRYCAAIKFVSDMDGFSYDSWDGIVGDIENKPGQDIVFLTHTERVVEVFKTGYEPLKIILADLGITLQPQNLWQIKIAGDQENDVLPVTFLFTPDDAKLYIDGKSAGNELTQSLSVGEHQIRLERDGYQTIEKTISVNEKQVFFQWQMEEAPDAGLQITTKPAGATIFLDGVNLGESPVAAFYPPGTYPIKISKDGYVPIENETLEVTLPQTAKNYTLEENVGYLTINTRPEATVYFNGQEMENHTRVKLSPQIVQLKVTMPKADELEEQVVIKKDDDLVLDLYPDIQTGTIQVAVTPFDADIELTGDAGEYYTAEGMKIFSNIPVGTYTLKVTAEGHKTTEETMVLKPNEKINKNITLEEGNDVDYRIEMVYVKGGTFNMGCTSEQSNCWNGEKPEHEVTVDDFYIGKHEVTQKQWREIMGNNPSDFPGCDNCPIENVSWNDVQEFIKKLNQLTGKKYRLPTEAEWEYAARGGASSSPTKYAGSNNIDQVAWYEKNSGGFLKKKQTHPVGQKQPNELGIYDMSGNVWEWCSDWYGSDYYSSSLRNNPQGPSSGTKRVLRGGSWYNGIRYCRVANRGGGFPDYWNDYFGFRLAQDF